MEGFAGVGEAVSAASSKKKRPPELHAPEAFLRIGERLAAIQTLAGALKSDDLRHRTNL